MKMLELRYDSADCNTPTCAASLILMCNLVKGWFDCIECSRDQGLQPDAMDIAQPEVNPSDLEDDPTALLLQANQIIFTALPDALLAALRMHMHAQLLKYRTVQRDGSMASAWYDKPSGLLTFRH